jgi:hypothetical protein
VRTRRECELDWRFADAPKIDEHVSAVDVGFDLDFHHVAIRQRIDLGILREQLRIDIGCAAERANRRCSDDRRLRSVGSIRAQQHVGPRARQLGHRETRGLTCSTNRDRSLRGGGGFGARERTELVLRFGERGRERDVVAVDADAAERVFDAIPDHRLETARDDRGGELLARAVVAWT